MTDPARDTTLPSIVEPIAGGSPTATHPCEAAFLRNLTGGRVVVQGAGDVVHLPPLGEIEMSPERIDLFDETVLAGEPRVQLYRAVSPEAEDRASTAVGVVGVVALLVAVGVGVGLGWQWGLLAYAITMVVGLVAGRFLTKVRVGVLVHWLDGTRPAPGRSRGRLRLCPRGRLAGQPRAVAASGGPGAGQPRAGVPRGDPGHLPGLRHHIPCAALLLL